VLAPRLLLARRSPAPQPGVEGHRYAEAVPSAASRPPAADDLASPTSPDSSDTPDSPAAPVSPADVGPSRFINRELSWLDFNQRVLALAGDERVPVLERAKFLAIFSQNLDEFFQVRVAGLKDQVAAGVVAMSADGRTPAQQLIDVRERLDAVLPEMGHTFLDQVAPALADAGIRLSSWADLDEDDEKFLVETFEERIFPVLTPLAVDPGHPFPYISNLSLNLAVVVRDPDSGEQRFARVKVPSLLPRFVMLPDGERYVPLEQVIAAHLDELFPGMEIEQTHPFRVTRNADLTLEEEDADDLLAAVELELRRRRFGRAVRLEVQGDMTDEVRRLLQRELDLDDDDVYVLEGPLDLGGLWTVYRVDRPDLKDEPYQPVVPARLMKDDEPADVFAAIRRGDILVHHPYDSFSASVEELVRQASVDPRVLAIKMTLYRTSGDSPVVKSLIRAGEDGKQVAALVELKARFDESANIEWARALETAGVHVAYGLIGLKVHAKTLLIVRDEADGLRRYCHIGTGNYNSTTAALYEDIGLMTCDPVIGNELSQLFNELTGFSHRVEYEALLVAPRTMRQDLVELIRQEAAAPQGRIVMKMNTLADPELIDELYAASQAGVDIDLLVRGICSLVPGLPGLSENIRARSLIGRYLEHSRIYYFGNGGGPGEPRYIIGSADIRARNLDRRVEVLVGVKDPGLQERLQEVFDVELADDVLAWELDATGTWTRRQPLDPEQPHNTHRRLQELAIGRMRRAASAETKGFVVA
jgi:polyphosphate kinase